MRGRRDGSRAGGEDGNGMMPASIANAVVTATALIAARVLFDRRLHDTPGWRATVTR